MNKFKPSMKEHLKPGDVYPSQRSGYIEAAGGKVPLKPVKSLAELKMLANTDPAYAKLMRDGALNLGWDGHGEPYRWLELNASETTEEGVVEEVNFCIEGVDRG